MAKADLKFDGLIDSNKLRQELTALTANSDGNGSTSEIRKLALALLKKRSAESRAKIEQMLLHDGKGLLCAKRLCHLQDELIRCLYDFAIVHVFRSPNLSAGERMSIIAVGGYGRGTLAPGSDLDLLFLLPYKQTALGESIIEYILYMLWDMGFKVGHATRTIDECIRLSREDMTIRTSVLEARYLWGESDLYEELVERFNDEIVRKTAGEFIASKLAERDIRHRKSGRSRYLVEPNIKEGKGGLRDLHTLFWISKYYYQLRTKDALKTAGVFSRSEFRTFEKANDFLWSVRCNLHFQTGRSEERLSFDMQPLMAERLGYTSRPGINAVERFMKHYFIVAKSVGNLTRTLCAAMEEEQAIAAPGFADRLKRLAIRSKKIKGSREFVNHLGRIKPLEEDVFARNPRLLLKVYRLAEENGLNFHPDTTRLISRSLKLIDKELRNDQEANADFLAVLTSPKTPEINLRKMNESGVLGRFIPEFNKIVAMMQFNMYHHYTVDEHLLRSIGILSEIEHGEVGEQHPLANELMEKTSNRVVLYVALLLHDIAKGRPEDHSIAGARVARKLCPRFGLDETQTQLVSWLVEHHLLMSTTAQSRDLNDPKTISDFAQVMQRMERLNGLLILTVCDIKAVGPDVWNGWKGQLLRTLYYETEPRLSGGFTTKPRRERVAEVRAELLEGESGWEKSERQKIVDLHYDNYLLMVDRDDQKRHLEFIRDVDRMGETIATTVITRDFEAITEITIIAPNHPRLLSTITGCCAASDANIADAKIFTMKDGRALDSIFINRAFETEEDERRRAERICDLIKNVLNGERRLRDVLAERTKPKGRIKAFSVKPYLQVDNTLSDYFTVIEIEGLDRAGLLSDLTSAFADLSLDIASAHIATFGEKAIDSFYITDLMGTKVTSPQKLAAIKRKLMSVLGGSANEGPDQPLSPEEVRLTKESVSS